MKAPVVAQYSGDHIKLRRIEAQDAIKIKEWRNEQMDVLRQVRALTDEDQVVWLEKIKKDATQSLFSIEDCSGELVGYCGLTNIDRINRRGEISFLVATGMEPSQYKVIFLETLKFLCEHGFSTLGLHKIFTETYAFRTFHISVLEEFGLICTGRLVDHISMEGRFVDSLIHSIINVNDYE